MNAILKRYLKKTPLYPAWREWKHKNDIQNWERGRPSPAPHAVKQRVLREHARRYGLQTLVETGTYHGDMVEAMRLFFTRVFSIELSEELHKRAQERFRDFPHIEILHGDSGFEIKTVLRKLTGPALFWLDGHYSGGMTAKAARDTPICDELQHILESPETGHIILVDDARLFGKDKDYPEIGELEGIVHSLQPNLDISVDCDIIRISPRVPGPSASSHNPFNAHHQL